MKISRKYILRCFFAIAVVVLAIAIMVIIVIAQQHNYAIKEGTVVGEIRISDVYDYGSSCPILLVSADGKVYHLAKTADEAAYHTIMEAQEGDWLEVSGRYWRPRKHKGTTIIGGGRAYNGPKITDDPLDYFVGADFTMEVHNVKEWKGKRGNSEERLIPFKDRNKYSSR